MKRIFRYILCCTSLFMCVPSFSNQQLIMISLNEAKHYHAKSADKVYIQADRFQRKSNANYYKLIVQSAVKSPVRVVQHQGYYSVAVGPLASATSIRKAADKLKYDPGLTASKHPTKVKSVASSFIQKHNKNGGSASHKQLALYERGANTESTTAEPATDATTEPTTEPTTAPSSTAPEMTSESTAPTTGTEQTTNSESATNTEPSINSEQAVQSDQTQQDDQAKLDEQAKQAEQAKLDEEARQVEQAKLNEQAKMVEEDKRINQVKQPKSEAVKNPVVVKKQSHLRAMLSTYIPAEGNWIVSAGGGVSYPSFGSSMGVNNNSGAPAPNNLDIYTTKSRTQPVVALLAGYRWVRANQWLPAFSLNMSYQHLFSRNVGGEVIQYSDPEFTNYNYDWEVASDILMGLLKANIFAYQGVSPYLLGGIGAAFNKISNYSEGPLSGVTPRTNPAFGSNTTTSFAYRIGAGLEYQIDPQILISAEYQFQSIGNIASDKGTQAWSGQYLNLGSYQSNAVLLNVTYLFGVMT